MNPITLADIPLLWRAESLTSLGADSVPTGYRALDQALGGGWPRPSLIELLCDEYGIGELRLLLGLLKHSSSTTADPCRNLVVWLSPPYDLQAVAIAQYGMAPSDHWVCSVPQSSDLHWAMSQALRSGACLAVIAWTQRLKPAALRSLKLAAMTGRSVGILFRPSNERHLASPANIRIALRAHADALEASILKVQGRRPSVVRIEPLHVDHTRNTVK